MNGDLLATAKTNPDVVRKVVLFLQLLQKQTRNLEEQKRFHKSQYYCAEISAKEQ